MFGVRTPLRSAVEDEAEKPFWISYSDLMTALMVLFLVAMSVALLSITQKVVSGPAVHNEKIEACMNSVDAMTKQAQPFSGITIQGHKISFGTRARFDRSSHKLEQAAEKTLRAYIPKVLELALAPDGCSKVFKRVIVEGFASQSGTYIHNLNLSLQRAERVLCVLLDSTVDGALTPANRKNVRDLFLVAGSSFNNLGPTPAESQRIELKLEFLAYEEKKEEIREAPLDQVRQCPLDQ